MSDQTRAATGGYYCGKVRYSANAVSTALTECHCSQCRKQSGHRYATTATKTGAVTIEGAENLSWFRASSDAERGFCSTCGSQSLFGVRSRTIRWPQASTIQSR